MHRLPPRRRPQRETSRSRQRGPAPQWIDDAMCGVGFRATVLRRTVSRPVRRLPSIRPRQCRPHRRHVRGGRAGENKHLVGDDVVSRGLRDLALGPALAHSTLGAVFSDTA